MLQRLLASCAGRVSVERDRERARELELERERERELNQLQAIEDEFEQQLQEEVRRSEIECQNQSEQEGVRKDDNEKEVKEVKDISKEKEKNNSSKPLRARIWEICQVVYHPSTGAMLLSEETIISVLNEHRMIKEYAYILHDKDTYVEGEEGKIGEKKAAHWHIVLKFADAVNVNMLAKWFRIEPQYIRRVKGKSAFNDMLEYLTHSSENEQRKGKYLYDMSEVKANFNYIQRVTDIKAKRELAVSEDDKKLVRRKVLYEGMSLKEVIKNHPAEYLSDFSYLEKCRIHYINNIAKLPVVRMNIYIEGSGGIGKGLFSKALARALADPLNEKANENDDDLFYVVSPSETISFSDYDGQEVLIWNEFRAETLLKVLGGRENVYDTFDMFPSNTRQNIKYGSLRLINRVNIVNSVQPYSTFIEILSGEYRDKRGVVRGAEDPSQSIRRFPIFLVISENSYDMWLNKGTFYNTREYETYLAYKNIKANFKKIIEKCGENSELKGEFERQALKPVIEKCVEIERIVKKNEASDNAVNEFSDYGVFIGEVEELKMIEK